MAQYYPKLMGQPTQRFHDLTSPPIIGLFTPFVGLVVGWASENGFQGAPSKRLMDSFAMSMFAQYRFLKQGSLRLAEVSGLKWQPAEEQAAFNDLSFLRSRIKMFSANNPVYAAKVARQGTMQTTMLGRTEFAPFKDDLEAALLTGNTHQAAATIRAWLQRFPPAERDARLKSLRESVSASEPVRVAPGSLPAKG